MVSLVVERRTKISRLERAGRIPRIITERTAILVITHRTRQRVICSQVGYMERALATTDVQAVVPRAPAGGLVANAAQHRHARRGERGAQWFEETQRYVRRINRSIRIQIDGFVLVKAEYVNVFGFNHRLRIDRPGVTAVPLLGHGCAIVRIHEAANGTGCKCRLRRGNRGEWIAQMPGGKRDARARHDIGGAVEQEGRLEDGGVGLLLHEQRDVLEGVVVVHPEAAADNLIATAGQVVGEPYARAETLAVIGSLLGHQRSGQGAERRGRLEFLEGTAVGNVCSADEIEILVPTESKVHCQPMGHFPVILEIQSELLGILDDEGGIAHRDAHAASTAVATNQQPRSLKSLRQRQDLAGQQVVIKLQSGVEFEETAHKRGINVIKSRLEGMVANGFGHVVFELVLTLNRVLGNIGVGTELDAGWEREKRRTRAAVNQVVPILETKGELIDQGGSKGRVYRQVGDLQVIDGEVSFCQIKEPVALVIQAVVGLSGNGEVCRMVAVDGPVEPSVDAVLKKRGRDGRGGLRSQAGYQ